MAGRFIHFPILICLTITAAVALSAAASPPGLGNIELRDGELMAIVQSGSTNSQGYVAVVNGDGSVKVEQSPDATDMPLPQLPAGTVDISVLRPVLAQIGDASRIPTGHCMKSVSFGTTTNIVYGGKRSGDLQCLAESGADIPPDHPPQETVANLRRIVGDIQAKIPVSRMRRFVGGISPRPPLPLP